MMGSITFGNSSGDFQTPIATSLCVAAVIVAQATGHPLADDVAGLPGRNQRPRPRVGAGEW